LCPLSARAQLQTLTFDDLPNLSPDVATYHGFDIVRGYVYDHALRGNGDGYPTYFLSDMPFNLISADFSSILVSNSVIVRGYTAAFVDNWNTTPFHDPFPVGLNRSLIPTPNYLASAGAPQGVFNTAVFNWMDLKAVFFDAVPAQIPYDPGQGWASLFAVDNIVVSVTPEPATLGLAATGLLLLMLLRRTVGRQQW
jgi:hypothetical protein